MPRRNVGEPTGEPREISGKIAGRFVRRADSQLSIREIERSSDDRHSRTRRDVIEAAAPRRHASSRPFRRDAENKALPSSEFRDRLIHDVVRRVSPDGNATDSSQNGSERPSKDRVLAQPGCVDVDRKVRENADDEVPVGRVRRDDNDELRSVRKGARYSPAEHAQSESPKSSEQRPPLARDGGWDLDGSGTGAGRQLGFLWCRIVMRPRVRS